MQHLHFVYLLYISLINCIKVGGTENSEIRHKTEHPKERKSVYGKKAIQTSFCNVRFKFVVDLLLPHETATAQRKQGILSKSSSEKNSPEGLQGFAMVNTSGLVFA